MCLSSIPRLLLFSVWIRISAVFKGKNEGTATWVSNAGYRTRIRSPVSVYTLHHHQRPRSQELCNEIYKYHRANCILFTINHSERACLPACPWARMCLLSNLASFSSHFSLSSLFFLSWVSRYPYIHLRLCLFAVLIFIHASWLVSKRSMHLLGEMTAWICLLFDIHRTISCLNACFCF